MVFSIESKVFKDGKTILAKYTCDGENISPPKMEEYTSSHQVIRINN